MVKADISLKLKLGKWCCADHGCRTERSVATRPYTSYKVWLVITATA